MGVADAGWGGGLMARVIEVGLEEEAKYRAWVAERPEAIRAIAERFDPWSLYRVRRTGQRVLVSGFFEDGSMSVFVSADFNEVREGMPREFLVFGIVPDDLEPCELPAAGDVAKIDRGVVH